MADGRRGAALDLFRLAAVVLVVANHTSPLASVSPLWDFWFTRVLARVAVPFFLMVSGYFLAKDQWRRTGAFLKKDLSALRGGGAAVSAVELVQRRLWASGVGQKAPAGWDLLSLVVFSRRDSGCSSGQGAAPAGPPDGVDRGRAPLPGGPGRRQLLWTDLPAPGAGGAVRGIFQIFAYTRNGLFFTPLFLLLGAAGVRWSVRTSAAGLCAAFAAMTAEGLWLHGLQVQRHDSMYMLLPLVMVCLFSLLLGLNRGERRSCRKLSSLIYVLHPWCIVLVRGGAEVLGLEGPLVENSMGHFLAVLASSAAASWVLWLAWSRRPLKRSNKG